MTAHAGLPLVVEAARAVRLEEVVEAKLNVAKRQRGFSETEKLEALRLLVTGGGDRIEDIRILAEDQGLVRLLDREIPSPDALLDFLCAFDDPQVWEQRPEDEKSWVPPESAPLVGLGEVNRELVARAAQRADDDGHDRPCRDHHRGAQARRGGRLRGDPRVSADRKSVV